MLHAERGDISPKWRRGALVLVAWACLDAVHRTGRHRCVVWNKKESRARYGNEADGMGMVESGLVFLH